jgi:hypothetical protein
VRNLFADTVKYRVWSYAAASQGTGDDG